MSTLARSDDVRRQNTYLILTVLRRLQQASRTVIAEQTQLSAATVSTITAHLLRQGILISQEDNTPNIKRGRPQVTLSINPHLGCIIVMALSMNHLSACLIDYSGKTIKTIQEQISTLRTTQESFEHNMIRLISMLISQQSIPNTPLRYIMVSVQGIVDAKGMTMLRSPITPLTNLDFQSPLARAFNVPVKIANDGDMIAEALHVQYPEHFNKNFAAILLDQGIGMGLILNGKRLSGALSSAGEFGHLVHTPNGALCRCGQRGCIEAYAGDYAIWRRVQQYEPDSLPVESLDHHALHAIIQRAQQQEGLERQAYREAGQAIGYGLRNLFSLLDPMPIAFIGSGTASFSVMEAEIRHVFSSPHLLIDANKLSFTCFSDAKALLHQGCATLTLRAVDQQLSSHP